LDHLDQGNIRLAVGYFPKLRDLHESELLYRSGFSCVYNPALLSLPESPSLPDLLLYPHIHTSYTGDAPGLFDQLLERQGLQRRIVVRAATPLSIPFVVKQSPLLAVLPNLVGQLFQNHPDLRIAPLAIDGFEMPISIVTHRREHSDPLTRYVAQQVVSSAQTQLAAPGGVRS
jgi:DNA-binding transcriptional LysR family regulator